MDTPNNLPTQVINTILSCLPLRDAVRTSALSRQWRYIWVTIPDLIFDYTLSRKRNLEAIIYKIILLHHGPIRKFSLHVPTYESTPAVDQWIYLLVNNQVQDLTLHFCHGNRHQIPSHLFRYDNLRHLDLYRCEFEPPAEFQGFRSLVTLNLQEVDFVPKNVQRLVSRCPNLEMLRLVECSDWDMFEVEGPCLRRFVFHGIFKSIKFKNCGNLSEVILSAPIVGNKLVQSRESIKHFEFVPTLEKLHLSLRLLEILYAGELPTQLPLRSLINLRILNLSTYLDTINEVACALFFIKNAPNLEILKLSLYVGATADEVAEFIRGQETPDPDLFQLRKVEVGVFSGMKSQMELLKYILASAIGLEEMLINSRAFSRPGNVELMVMNELRGSARLSPDARIVFQ